MTSLAGKLVTRQLLALHTTAQLKVRLKPRMVRLVLSGSILAVESPSSDISIAIVRQDSTTLLRHFVHNGNSKYQIGLSGC